MPPDCRANLPDIARQLLPGADGVEPKARVGLAEGRMGAGDAPGTSSSRKKHGGRLRVDRLLAELADLVAAGAVQVPIAATCPLDRITDAFAQLEQRQTRGKIVLIP